MEVIMSDLPIGTSPDDPQFVSLESPAASKFRITASGQQQVVTGSGVLKLIVNREEQEATIWDHSGGGPPASAMIGEYKPMQAGTHFRFDIRYTNGIRVDTAGTNIVVHVIED